MPETQFTQVQFTLQGLMNQVQMGNIGLPDIQRPFVWKNIKVRDLFDSMYRGYPVGYLLFWQNGLPGGHKQIGTDIKQLVPQLLVVDGQQRLTSLHAVLNNQPVLREDYSKEQIAIAFSPLEERFEVFDAAIAKDKSFIPNVSKLWAGDTGLFDLTDSYLTELRSTREVTPDEERRIKAAISRLNSLTSFPFTALVLSAGIDEEQVAEVFVRINSKGITLNQADFILTLMSVFWDEGRKDLEAFCRDAREPSEGRPSSFNWYMKPLPDQLLRASVGLGFKRARLQYVYSILRGKDLETKEFSDDRRIKQFEVLKKAQSQAIELQHWHDFWKVIRQAGYPNGKIITSENNLLYTYVMYLIGRCEYKMEEPRLRRLIARWFFMVTLTGRYTKSPESDMEFDLAMLRDVNDAAGFAAVLSRVCDETLTNDFWTINLPSDLATSAGYSPTMFSYYAALVLLDANALFSEQKVATLLGAGQQAPKSIERHHLFPKSYLARELKITSSRETNQTANYALADWSDNAWIADKAPSEYLPELIKLFAKPQMVPQMYHWHALPEGWETMEYKNFLERRRELMAAVIREGYETLRGVGEAKPVESTIPVASMVRQGEGRTIEFKGALRMNLHVMEKDPRIEFTAIRTIAGFLNSDGGTLVLGVMDNGDPIGYEADGFKSKDAMLLHLDNLVRNKLGAQFAMYIHPRFAEYQECEVLTVECLPSKSPVYMNDGNTQRFFIRAGASTSELTMSEALDYIKQRFV